MLVLIMLSHLFSFHKRLTNSNLVFTILCMINPPARLPGGARDGIGCCSCVVVCPAVRQPLHEHRPSLKYARVLVRMQLKDS